MKSRSSLHLEMFFHEIPAIMRLFVNLQALATLLLQTIGSKRVANAQTMKNNGSKVASAFPFNIKNF